MATAAEHVTDILVIGGGPGGYVAAIRAAQLGFSVTCVEGRSTLGGTCLNEGCIPSKALLHSSHLYEEARLHMGSHGIEATGVSLNLAALMKRKDGVVADLTKGIDYLFAKNKITRIEGMAQLKSPTSVQVGQQTLVAHKAIILATGSTPILLPQVTLDTECILTSREALSLSRVPARMMVVGGGYIGLEMGSVWRRLGAEVTVVEAEARVIPGMDADLGTALYKSLHKQGITFHLNTRVSALVKGPTAGVQATLLCQGQETHLEADVALIALGRKPFTQGLGLQELGIDTDARGCILVDDHFQTTCPGIYAIGDVIPGPMLAHKAEDEGVALAELLAGQKPHIPSTIPAVVYTHPQVASVGCSEETLRAQQVPYRVGKFPFSANARAKAVGDTEGFLKILAHADTDRVLGVHILGPDAETLIGEATLAMEFGASAEDIARTCHAHPTFSEVLKEAALQVGPGALHI